MTKTENEFQREERYIVIKRKHLTTPGEVALRDFLHRRGIETVECVVVESDWPEYETVWRMIEARVTGTGQPASPASEAGEPVAWRTEYRDVYRGRGIGWRLTYSKTEPSPCALQKAPDGFAGHIGHRNVTPLYTHPPTSRPSPASEAGVEWKPTETAPRDGTPFLATTMVSHIDGRRWRETHLIWCDDESGEVHADCDQGWLVDDYEYWMPLDPLLAKLEQGGAGDAEQKEQKA